MADDDPIAEELDVLDTAEPLAGKTRIDVFRDAVVFQFKLVLDGFLDVIMLPIALVAAAASVVTGHDWFYRSIRFGRGLDDRINLFGCAGRSTIEEHAPTDQKDQIELLAERVEQEIRRELADGKLRASARDSLTQLRQRLNRLTDDQQWPT